MEAESKATRRPVGDVAEFLRARLDEDEAAAHTASHVLRSGAHWSLDDWHGRERPHSLIAQGTAEQPVALGHFTADPVPTEQAIHIARHDPARILREVEAGRRLIRAHEKWCEGRCEAKYPDVGPDAAFYWEIKNRATAYSGHPDYREAWKV